MAGGGGEVRFGGKQAAMVGVVGGVAVAAGLPTVILIYGAHLGVPAQVALVILALLIGGVVTVISAVLGIVIPTSASGGTRGPLLGKLMKLNVEKNKDGTKKVEMEMNGGEAETTASPPDS